MRPAPPPPVPLRVEGRLVRDHEVWRGYPGAVGRQAEMVRWIDGSPAANDRLVVVPVDGAILTRIYLPIDPATGNVFHNQTFDNLPLPPGTPRLATGDAVTYDFDRLIDVPGRVVVVGGVLAGNYFHGLLNWFTRATIVEMLAPHIYHDPEVRFLLDVQAREEPFLSILKAMALPLDRVIWTDHMVDYRIEHALLPTFIHEGLLCRDVFEAHAARILATLGIARPARGHRRIWISREHAAPPRRRIVNFDAIAPALDAHGFERVVMEHLSFADQVRLFVEAEIVAGSHGAGFANLIFTPPNARMLIVEKDFARYLGIANLFANLARAMGRGCDLVKATSVLLDGVDYGVFINRHFADAEVDPAEFADALARTVRAAETNATGAPA